MSDEPLPLPDDDDTVSRADPFEAELVAYLDGELDTTAARKVEARLAADPAARVKATELKKSFDLLEYLPKPEPSPNFTTRTLDRIPAVKVSPASTVPATPSSPSLSVPVPLSTEAVPHSRPVAAPPRRGLWAAGILLAVCACAAASYFGTAAFQSRTPTVSLPPPPDELSISDHRLIENLPLYAAADDIEFIRELSAADLFGEEPALTVEISLKLPPVEPEKTSAPAFEKMAHTFKSLPPSRQQAVRDLDRALHTQPPGRDRLVRVLEVYAVWLGRLPEAERKAVLTATTPKKRLEEVRSIRTQQWIAALPEMQRKKLTSLPAAQQAELIRQWQTEEASRRTEWAFVRKHAAAIAADQIPWPFDDPTRRKDVIEFMRVTFHLDDPKHCRLSPTDLARYNGALTQATEKGGWWPWHTYGRVVYELTMLPSPLRKYELLPEPAELRLRHVDFSDLPQAYVAHANQKRMKDKLTPLVGKWPEFALELHNDLRMRKFAFTMPPLGPARVSEFKEPVRAFWEKELAPKLSSGEKAMLHTQEGRWPEYSRYFVFLARVHDLIIPDTMLPGSPAKWDSWYNPGYRIPGYPPSRP